MYRFTYRVQGEGGEYTHNIFGVETDEDAARRCRRFIDLSEERHGQIFIWGQLVRIDKPEEAVAIDVDNLCPKQATER